MAIDPIEGSQGMASLPLQPPSKGTRYRIKNAEDAASLVTSLVHAGRERSWFNAKIQGMVDLNPPFDAAKRRAAGLANLPNLNFGEGAAAHSSALVPYYDLFSGAQYYAEVRTAYGNPSQQVEWSGIITEEWDQMLRRFDGFDFNMQSMLSDRVLFGRGFLIWPERDSWHFCHVKQHRIFVPDDTRCYSGYLEVLVIRQRFSVTELWSKIRKPKVAEAAGWDVDEVTLAIGNAFPDDPQQGTITEYEDVQRKLRDRDIVEGVKTPKVPCAHILVREYDGKVSHCIVAEQPTRGQSEGKMERKYLFKENGRFDAFNEFVATFFLETLDGSWNGASGLGKAIYSTMEVKNRLKCDILQNAFLRSGITLQAKSADALESTQMISIGSLNVIPPGYDVQQATIFGDVEGSMRVDNFLDMMLSSNTGVYKQRMEKPTGNPRTAEEVRLQFQNSAVLSNSAVNRFYLDLDRFYAQTYKRTLKTAKRSDNSEAVEQAKYFIECCKRKGVPMEALNKTTFVRAMRNIGNGSMFMRQQAIGMTAPYVPMLPEGGRSQWISEMIAASAGQDAVARWNPTKVKPIEQQDQEALAMLENGILTNGAPVMRTDTNNDVIHAQIHLQAGAQLIQSVQQGADPSMVLRGTEQIGAHVAQHMQGIASDPSRKDVFRVLQEQFQKFSAANDELERMIGENQQAQQEQAQAEQQAQAIRDGTDPATVIKAAETESKIKMQQQKTDAGLAMKAQKHAQSMAIADVSAAQKIRSAPQKKEVAQSGA